MRTQNKVTKILTLLGFFLGLIIVFFYKINNKIGKSGTIYVVIILIITTIYGYLIALLYKIFKNKNWLNSIGISLYIIILLIITGLGAFSIYILFFALDLTSGY